LLAGARENARGVREIISAEMWEHINKFYLSIRDGGTLEGCSTIHTRSSSA
jgi:uncharacterized alpha-E superfamily protein